MAGLYCKPNRRNRSAFSVFHISSRTR